MKNRILYALYLIVVVAIGLTAIEYFAGKILAAKQASVDIAKGNFFDPNLGYAYPPSGPKVARLERRGHKFIDGFAIYNYAPSTVNDLARPIILVLGGSTSETFIEPKSWPEYLADMMRERGQGGQVINGAVAGYTSSQELFKLIRDGLEFSPNIIISYGGLRDREAISPLPFPMVPLYQRNIVERLAKYDPPLLPNTLSLALETYSRGFTFGLPTRNSHAQAWVRNMRIMNAASKEFGAGFCAILQPFATENTIANTSVNRNKSYFSTRESQIEAAGGANYAIDLTHFLDQYDEIFERGPYATDKGNKVIAERIYRLIFEERRCWPGNN
jgi:hypothetical protein